MQVLSAGFNTRHSIYRISNNINDVPEVLSKPVPKKSKVKEVSYTKDPTLNKILNETAQNDEFAEYPTMGGGTYDKSRMAEMMGYGANAFGQQAPPMTTPDGKPVTNVPDDVAKAMTRNYGDLMKAIEKKKGGSPLKP